MPAADTGSMAPTNVSSCGRFVIVDALHIDRGVFEALARWGMDHGLGLQDAIQVAFCAFIDRCVGDQPTEPVSPSEHWSDAHALDASSESIDDYCP